MLYPNKKIYFLNNIFKSIDGSRMYISIRFVCVLLACVGAFIDQPIVHASDHRSSMLVKAFGFACGYTAGYMRGIMVYHNALDGPDLINKTQLLGFSISGALVVRKQWVPHQGQLLSDGAAGYSIGFLLGALCHMHSNRIVLQESLKQRSDSIESLNQEIFLLQNAGNIKDGTIATLEARCKRVGLEHRDLDERCKRLYQENESLSNQNKFLREDFRKKSEKIKKDHLAALEELKRQLQEVQASADRRKKREKEASLRAEKAEQECADLNNRLENLIAQYDSLRAKDQESNRKLLSEKDVNKQLLLRVNELNAEYDRLQVNYRELFKHAAALDQQLKNMSAEKEVCVRRIQELEPQIKQLEDQVKRPQAPPAYDLDSYPRAPQPYGALGAPVLQQNMLFSTLLQSALRDPDNLPRALHIMHQFFCVAGELELLFNFLHEKPITIFAESTIAQCSERAGVLIQIIESIMASCSCNERYRNNSLKLEFTAAVKQDPTIILGYYCKVLRPEQQVLPKHRFSHQEPLVSYLVVNVGRIRQNDPGLQDVLVQLLEYEQGIYERVQKGERRINQSDYIADHRHCKRLYQSCLTCTEEITSDCYNCGYEYRICGNNHVYQMCATCALSDRGGADISSWYTSGRCPLCRDTNIQIVDIR